MPSDRLFHHQLEDHRGRRMQRKEVRELNGQGLKHRQPELQQV